MYLQEFPNIDWLRKNALQGFAGGIDYHGNILPTTGWPNVILSVDSSATERDEITGPFSLFYNLSGKSLVGLDSKWFQVSSSFYCLSNNGQTYDLHIPKGEHSKTFNIHFGKSLFEEVTQLIFQKNEWALDNLNNIHIPGLEVLSRTEYMDDDLRSKLLQLHRYRQFCEGDYSLDREYEMTASILEHLILHAQSKLKKLHQISALKSGTRKELFKRVNVGLDYMHSNELVNLDLKNISQNSGLSKFHYIRVFKEIFGITPTAYISHLRVKKANGLILRSNKDLGEIAIELGFSELSAFTRFYKRLTGITPSSIRK